MPKKYIESKKSSHKKSKPWQQESALRITDQGKHSTSYQNMNSATQSLNKQKKSHWSFKNEKHKGPKV